MKERKLQFISALEDVYPPEEIQYILDYEVSAEDLNNIASMGRQLLTTIPTLSSICASMSSKWYEFIKFHTTVPVCVITGHLEIQNQSLFTQKVPVNS